MKAFIHCDFIAAALHSVHRSFNQSLAHPTICIAFLCKMDTGMVVTLNARVFICQNVSALITSTFACK